MTVDKDPENQPSNKSYETPVSVDTQQSNHSSLSAEEKNVAIEGVRHRRGKVASENQKGIVSDFDPSRRAAISRILEALTVSAVAGTISGVSVLTLQRLWDNRNIQIDGLEIGWTRVIYDNFDNLEFIQNEIGLTDWRQYPDRRFILETIRNIKLGVVNCRQSNEALNRYLEMDANNFAREVIRFLKAKNYIICGHSKSAYDELKSIPIPRINRNDFHFDVLFNKINAEFSLLKSDYYRGSEKYRFLHEVENLYQLHNNNVESPEVSIFQSGVSSYGSRFSFLHFIYWLDRSLHSGLSTPQRREIWDYIVTTLQALSGVRRENVNSFYREAWYPLVLLHVAAWESGDPSYALSIESMIRTFNGWEDSAEVRRDFVVARESGNMQAGIFTLNEAIASYMHGDREKILEIIEKMDNNTVIKYSHAAFDRKINEITRGDNRYRNFDPLNSIFTKLLFEDVQSHTNYIIEYDTEIRI